MGKAGEVAREIEQGLLQSKTLGLSLIPGTALFLSITSAAHTSKSPGVDHKQKNKCVMSIQLSKCIGYWQDYLEKLGHSLGKLGEMKRVHVLVIGR